jgi:hypothetical protein
MIVLVGCSSSDRIWSDLPDSWTPAADPVTVAEGDGWRLEVGTSTGPPSDRPGTTCVQPVVADQPLACVPVDAPAGNVQGGAVRAGGERVVWQGSTIDPDATVDHYVVWSTASPDGRRIDPIVHGSVEHFLWIMQPDEAPWGYQSIARDGTLISQTSFVGLPAD